MSTTRRRRYSAEFKAKVALEAIRGEQTIADFCVAALKDALARYGKPADLQHRPRKPVHQRCLYQGAQRRRNPHFHGRQGALDRQCHDRAAVALPQVRVHLSARLRDWQRGSPGLATLDRVLQHAATAF